MTPEQRIKKGIAAMNQDETLQEILRAILPAAPNTTYWKNKLTGVEYHYTTEKARFDFKEGYWVIVYKPIGKGARTNKAKRFKMIDHRGPYDRLTCRRLAKQMYLESKE